LLLCPCGNGASAAGGRALSGDDDARALEREVGHPRRRWHALLSHVTDNDVRQFADIQDEWLALMWCLDTYRHRGIVPLEMGSSKNLSERSGAINRGKGNWFAQLLAALVENRTSEHVASASRVQGFSQEHQIDLAWPRRDEDPLVCAEAKVTGAPAYGKYPERGATKDFSNRRKELKFAATDLKLYRRDRDTAIRHWGAWREESPPKTYFLWAARLRRGKLRQYKHKPARLIDADSVDSLVREADALVKTYLDGAGLFAWRVNVSGTGYEPVPLAVSDRVTELDDVLHRIASQIEQFARAQGGTPAPVRPVVRAVGRTSDLLQDDPG
jgi:hypothetical protein